MKLLVLATEFPPGPGGIGCHAFEVARQLHRVGWQVKVIARQDYATDDEIQAFSCRLPFTVTDVAQLGVGALGKGIARWRLASSVVKEWQPDVILATGQSAVWLGSVLAQRHGLGWIAVGHGSEFGDRTWWRRLLTRRSYGRASTVVCVSEFTRTRMHAGGIRPRQEEVIPNGASPEILELLGKSVEVDLPVGLARRDGHILLTVGNVSSRKGQDIAIRAMPEILASYPNTQYVIAGLPTMHAEFSELSIRLGVSQSVHFLGKVDSKTLARLYQLCDVFVLTSRNTEQGDAEGYGIVVIEAALCGKPAVVTRECGLEEAVMDGITGLTVPQEDPAAVARAAKTLLRDPESRHRLGQNARDRAFGQTWDRQAQSFDAILRSVAT